MDKLTFFISYILDYTVSYISNPDTPTGAKAIILLAIIGIGGRIISAFNSVVSTFINCMAIIIKAIIDLMIACLNQMDRHKHRHGERGNNNKDKKPDQ